MVDHATAEDVFEEVDLLSDDAASPPPAPAKGDGDAPAAAPAAPGGGGSGGPPCHVCGDGAGRHECVSCERPACSQHLWTMYALCTECATEEEIQRLQGRRTAADWRDLLGIKWVQ